MASSPIFATTFVKKRSQIVSASCPPPPSFFTFFDACPYFLNTLYLVSVDFIYLWYTVQQLLVEPQT